MSNSRNQGFKRARAATPLADVVSKLLNPVIEQRAGMTSELVASWAEIAGDRFAATSRPEKLIWPKQIDDAQPFEAACLVVACEAASALFIQHETALIIRRINTYFGYAAVSKIKIVQKTLPKDAGRKNVKPQKLSSDQKDQLQDLLAGVDDPRLREALQKMGQGVFSESSGKKGQK